MFFRFETVLSCLSQHSDIFCPSPRHRDGQLSCMLIDTEKEHGGPSMRKSECDSPVIGKSQFPSKATLSSISKDSM